MNKIVSKFLLSGDQFLSETYLRQSGFTCSACERFTTKNLKTKKFKETGDSRYIYLNKLHKAFFQYDMACEDFKDLPRKNYC